MAHVPDHGGVSAMVRKGIAGVSRLQAGQMNGRREFRPLQAQEIARAFQKEGVEYLFGKSGAILLGYPGMTQDVDVFPERSVENGKRLLAALRKIGFEIS